MHMLFLKLQQVTTDVFWKYLSFYMNQKYLF